MRNSKERKKERKKNYFVFILFSEEEKEEKKKANFIPLFLYSFCLCLFLAKERNIKTRK
jgi:hypothetical protein